MRNAIQYEGRIGKMLPQKLFGILRNLLPSLCLAKLCAFLPFDQGKKILDVGPEDSAGQSLELGIIHILPTFPHGNCGCRCGAMIIIPLKLLAKFLGEFALRHFEIKSNASEGGCFLGNLFALDKSEIVHGNGEDVGKAAHFDFSGAFEAKRCIPHEGRRRHFGTNYISIEGGFGNGFGMQILRREPKRKKMFIAATS